MKVILITVGRLESKERHRGNEKRVKFKLKTRGSVHVLLSIFISPNAQHV